MANGLYTHALQYNNQASSESVNVTLFTTVITCSKWNGMKDKFKLTTMKMGKKCDKWKVKKRET